MTPDAGTLTSLLNSFSAVCTAGLGSVIPAAKVVLGKLILLDLVLAILLNIADQDHIKLLVQKTLKFGFWIWLVTNWGMFLNVISKSFVKVGLDAGGGGLSASVMSDPSMLVEQGIFISQPIFTHIQTLSGWDVLFNLHDIILTGLCGILIVAAYAIIGIQVFVTYLEFYIVGTLALILIPWGVFQHTKFLSEKAIGAVIGFGIKLMVLSFIAAVSIPLVSSWALPADPKLLDCIRTLVGSAAIAWLAWHTPSVAQSLLTGSPSLTAGTAIAPVATAAGMAVGGAMAINSMQSNKTAQQGVQATRAAAMAMNNAAGAMSKAANPQKT